MLNLNAEVDPTQEANVDLIKKVHQVNGNTPPALLPKNTWESLQRRPFSKVTDDHYLRQHLVKVSSWCILTQEVADILGRFLQGKSVIEVFAGTGYIAHHLRLAAGLTRREYRAYDNYSTHKEHRGIRYPGVTQKNAFQAPIKSADVVIMTWPAYAANHAERIVKKMRHGQYLIYNGEGYGGCTGNDAFHDYLDSHFLPLNNKNEALYDVHAQHAHIRDQWTIWRKRR